MKSWLGAWNRLSWGREFWLFTIRYYVPPWHRWKASLSMANENGERINLLLRISNIVTNYIQAVIVGVVMFLLAKNVLEANWLSVGALLAVAPALLGVLLIRLQAPFRLGFGERG
jgi:hypothetical protein